MDELTNTGFMVQPKMVTIVSMMSSSSHLRSHGCGSGSLGAFEFELEFTDLSSPLTLRDSLGLVWTSCQAESSKPFATKASSKQMPEASASACKGSGGLKSLGWSQHFVSPTCPCRASLVLSKFKPQPPWHLAQPCRAPKGLIYRSTVRI